MRSGFVLASDLLGRHVRNGAGEDLGKVEDFVVDPRTGDVQYGVMSTGGIFGMGDKFVPVPWSAFSMAPAHDHLVLDVSTDFIQRAPSFDRKAWPDMADTVWQNRVRDYYGMRSTLHSTSERTGPVPERTVVVPHRVRRERRPVSTMGGVFAILLLIGGLALIYMISTRGWDRTRNELTNSARGVAYAMKETSEDAALTTKVKTAMSLSSSVPAMNIDVDSHDGVVTLRGEVPDEGTKAIAEMIARDTDGVGTVHNELAVNPAAVAQDETERMRDRVAELETQYRANEALLKDQRLQGQDIRVAINGSVATMDGTVHTPDQKYHAETIVRQTLGVQSVINRLNVASTAGGDADRALADKVEFALSSTQALDTAAIQVHDFNGTITLTGTVASPAEKLLAEEKARQVEGVGKVINNLQIVQ